MNQPFSNKFMADEKNLALMKELMWGPNGIRQAEELASFFTIRPDAKILEIITSKMIQFNDHAVYVLRGMQNPSRDVHFTNRGVQTPQAV